MNPEIPSNVDQLAALQHRIETLEAKLATKPSFFSSRRRRAMAGTAAVVAALGVAGTALASTITDGLYVFVADNPALASEVNANFNTLRTYLRNKVGQNLTNGNVAVPGTLSAAGATTLGTLTAGTTTLGTVTATSFVGPVTGNVTGNLTGNVTGNVTGNLTGNVSGTLNGLRIEQKAGNNGSASCSQYCASSVWGGWSGGCIGAVSFDDANYDAYDCLSIPGVTLMCYCVRY